MFYFEAQTGLIRNELPASPSRFHNYKLPAHARERVEDAVACATEGAGGLVYTKRFLKWLQDTEIHV